MAILVGLAADEQLHIVQANVAQLTLRGRSSLADTMAMWERSRALGCGTNFGDIAAGVNAVAVPVSNRHGAAFASITLAGPQTRLPQERCHELVAPLRCEALRYAELAARVHPDLYGCAVPG